MMKSSSNDKQAENLSEEMIDFSEENTHERSKSIMPIRFSKSFSNMNFTVQFLD